MTDFVPHQLMSGFLSPGAGLGGITSGVSHHERVVNVLPLHVLGIHSRRHQVRARTNKQIHLGFPRVIQDRPSAIQGDLGTWLKLGILCGVGDRLSFSQIQVRVEAATQLIQGHAPIGFTNQLSQHRGNLVHPFLFGQLGPFQFLLRHQGLASGHGKSVLGPRERGVELWEAPSKLQRIGVGPVKTVWNVQAQSGCLATFLLVLGVLVTLQLVVVCFVLSSLGPTTRL